MTRYTVEDRQRISTEIEALKAQGMTLNDACKKVGMKLSSYYNWTSRKGKHKMQQAKTVAKPAVIRKKTESAVESFVVNVPRNNTPFVFIMGDSQDVKFALDRLGVRQ